MPEGVPAPPETCWLHPGVEVRESPIEGRGLFASSSTYVDTITVLPDVHLVLPGRQPIGYYGDHWVPALQRLR